MIYIKCPLCRNQHFTVLYKSTLTKRDLNISKITKSLLNSLDNSKKHGQVVKCNNCSLVYVNPAENYKIISQGYKNVIDKSYLETEIYRKRLSENHLKYLMQFKRKGNILDVGCFAGFFPEIAGEKGWKTDGIEPSNWAKKIAITRGVNIVGNSIESANLNKEFYDVITMWDVIEHLPNPHKAIKTLSTALKRKGIIVIGTPDIDSYVAKILKENFPYLVRMHLALYSRKTLKRLLEDNGLTVLDTKSYGRIFPLLYILEKSPLNGKLFSSFKKLIKSVPSLRDFGLNLNIGDSFIMIAQKK